MSVRRAARGSALIAAGLVAALPLLAARAGAQPIVLRAVNVNCGQPGQTIAAALRRQVAAVGLVVNITGVCNEHVDIFRDDVILRGAAAGATIHGPTTGDSTVFIDGAKRVHLQDLTITGGSDGVSGTRGASFFLEHVTVQGAARLGVVATYSSSVFISNGSIVRQSGSNGVTVSQAAGGNIIDSTIENNTGGGVVATRASYIRIGQDTVGSATPRPVTVQNNGSGITVTESSSGNILAATVQNNTGNGIYVGRSAHADIGIGSFSLVAANTIVNNGATSSGILVEGASANIVGNTISGNGFGVQFINGGNGRLGIRPDTIYLGNTISDNKLAGLGINSGSTAVIGANTISGNGAATSPGNRWGVIVSQGSANFIGQNIIENHADSGIFLNMSKLFLGNGFGSLDRTGNIIRNNGFGAESTTTRSGINVFNGSSASILNTTLTGNTRANVDIFMAADVDIRNSILSEPVPQPGGFATNIIAQNRGVVRIDGLTVVETSPGDGILMMTGSAFDVRNAGAIVRNNGGFGINCIHGETSINNTQNIVFEGNGTGDISPDCTGY